jgi:hypothetical protein
VIRKQQVVVFAMCLQLTPCKVGLDLTAITTDFSVIRHQWICQTATATANTGDI